MRFQSICFLNLNLGTIFERLIFTDLKWLTQEAITYPGGAVILSQLVADKGNATIGNIDMSEVHFSCTPQEFADELFRQHLRLVGSSVVNSGIIPKFVDQSERLISFFDAMTRGHKPPVAV